MPTVDNKKFLNYRGLIYLLSKLDEYPNNEVLATVIDAIGAELDAKAGLDVATLSTNGLLSHEDKNFIEQLKIQNPDISSDSTVSKTIEDANQVIVYDAAAATVEDLILSVECNVIRTKNLYDPREDTLGYYIGANGMPARNIQDAYTAYIPVTPGETIHIYGVATSGGQSINKRCHGYNIQKTWVEQVAVATLAANTPLPANYSLDFTVPNGIYYIILSHRQDDENIMIERGEKTSYVPYGETLAGYDSLNLYVSPDGTIANGNTVSLTFPETIYGAELDMINDTLTINKGFIASYNGETLPGVWRSNQEDYVAGTTPSTGAQVVYELETPRVIPFNIPDISLNANRNYVWTDIATIIRMTYTASGLTVPNLIVSGGALQIGNTILTETDLQQLLSLIP